MKTDLCSIICCSVAMIGSALLIQPVKADLTIVEKTVVNAPGVKQVLMEIPDQQRAPLLKMMSPMLAGEPWITTTFLKGSRLRTDMGETSVVINSATGHEVTMNRIAKQYSIGPYDPFQKAAGQFTFRIAPTGRTGTMLGHPIQQYSITLASSVLPKSAISGDLWAAPDLPTPPSPGYAGGIAADFQAQMAQVKGMPLAYRLVYRNTPEGDITITSFATSIDATTISPSTFRIPSDYTKGILQHSTTTPSTGYPLGDGVPLDSTDSVTNDMIGADGGDSGGDTSALGNISPAMLQGLLGGMSGGSGGDPGSALGGLSPSAVAGLLGGSGGSSVGSSQGGALGSLGNLVNPQMLNQLSSEMQSLLNDDGD